jgi:hypothetical protein
MEQSNTNSVEYQWQMYLRRIGLWPEEIMMPDQRKQLKRAFFGAWGQFLMMLKHDMPEEEQLIHDLLDQQTEEVGEFWKKQL